MIKIADMWDRWTEKNRNSDAYVLDGLVVFAPHHVLESIVFVSSAGYLPSVYIYGSRTVNWKMSYDHNPQHSSHES